MKRPSNSRSEAAFQRARAVIPGGVNSPVRAYRAVGGSPFFVASARGAKIRDIDGREYLDYVGSWGPMILGHAPKEVLAAIGRAAERGTSYGAPTVAEVEMAELLSAALPSIEKVRLVSSGTEACMSALRVARGFTKRDDIVKFEGCYHGHSDGMLVKAGSGAATFGVPTSPGVPGDYAKHTLVLPYNDLEAVRSLVRRRWKTIAAIIVEPVAGNMGVVLPAPGFLEGLRELTSRHGIALIFDEVITGFRLCYGGAQSIYGIAPDLTCLGKIIGGGLPAAAYGGNRDIMSSVSPDGPVYQAGTLSGNPLAVAAGLAQLRTLRDNPAIYANLETRAAQLSEAFRGVTVNRVGSMLTPFFARGPVTDWPSAAKSDTKKFAKFHRHMRDRGIALAPSQFEAWFVSYAHTKGDIDRTAKAIQAFRA
ncbi:MAG: glutamate-1-semialdehyde-2,1-aminomutase [Planctomycetota bacterium]|nr:MAG: glutamate-1-semialdehyde-2,1-aminomutase [Planctomycetota bacterium]